MPLYRKYISAVTPLPDYILRVDFVSGSRLLLDMKPYLDKLRFRPLADPAVWNSAMTNGIFVRFDNVELSHDEILSMAERAHCAPIIPWRIVQTERQKKKKKRRIP